MGSYHCRYCEHLEIVMLRDMILVKPLSIPRISTNLCSTLGFILSLATAAWHILYFGKRSLMQNLSHAKDPCAKMATFAKWQNWACFAQTVLLFRMSLMQMNMSLLQKLACTKQRLPINTECFYKSWLFIMDS